VTASEAVETDFFVFLPPVDEAVVEAEVMVEAGALLARLGLVFILLSFCSIFSAEAAFTISVVLMKEKAVMRHPPTQQDRLEQPARPAEGSCDRLLRSRGAKDASENAIASDGSPLHYSCTSMWSD